MNASALSLGAGLNPYQAYSANSKSKCSEEGVRGIKSAIENESG